MRCQQKLTSCRRAATDFIATKYRYGIWLIARIDRSTGAIRLLSINFLLCSKPILDLASLGKAAVLRLIVGSDSGFGFTISLGSRRFIGSTLSLLDLCR
jgi:hypothetical protein